MIYPFDFHTHTSYCDGKNSPEEMVKSAIDKNLKAIGFSGHSFTEFDKSYCMSEEQTEKYIAEITALKEKYKDKICVFCGIEKDYYSKIDDSCFDYVIGSVHYTKTQGKYLDIDLSAENFCDNVKEFYGGNFYAFCNDYYKNVADVYNKTKCDIIGHIDLISKFIETNPFPITEHYKKAALECIRSLIPYNKPFEINVGAITRGYRTTPYPADFILSEINRLGGKIVISGDCHNKENLGDCLDFALEYAKKCEFKERFILTENGFEPETI